MEYNEIFSLYLDIKIGIYKIMNMKIRIFPSS